MAGDTTPTTREAVAAYETTSRVFSALFEEIKQLSRKKSDATMNKFKVGQINRILEDIKRFVSDEPEAKYLDLLSDDSLPQVGDAVIVMAQFEAALRAFHSRHNRWDNSILQHVWFIVDKKK